MASVIWRMLQVDGAELPDVRIWDERIDQRIAELKQLKIDIVNCTCGRAKAPAHSR